MLDYRTHCFLNTFQEKITRENETSEINASVPSTLGSTNVNPLDKLQQMLLNPPGTVPVTRVSSLDDLQKPTLNPLDKLQELRIGNKNLPNENNFHYMDVMNVIYNCCDNILLQVIMEKLYICRLAIPLILPDTNKNTLTFLLWALRGIIPQPKDVCLQELSLVNIPQLFFLFVRVGATIFIEVQVTERYHE